VKASEQGAYTHGYLHGVRCVDRTASPRPRFRWYGDGLPALRPHGTLCPVSALLDRGIVRQRNKSTLVPLLRLCLPGYVVFEGEAIDFWRFDGPPGDYGSLYNQWLKVGYEIALNGCPVVIAATALPAQLEACTMRCRFTTIAYLGLVCRPDTQTARLLHRPPWRNAAAPKFIAAACTFSRQLETAARADPTAIMLHDTTDTRPEASAQEIAAWVRVQLLQP